MKKIERLLYPSDMFTATDLSRKNIKNIWISLVKEEYMLPEIIKDDELREEYISLIRNFENCVREARISFMGVENGFLKMSKQDESIKKFNELQIQFSESANKLQNWVLKYQTTIIDLDLYLLQLCKQYEDTLRKEPKEFENMKKEEKRDLDELVKRFLAINAVVREEYQPSENKYICKQYMTRGQEKKILKNAEENNRKFNLLLQSITGKEDFTQEERSEVIRLFFGKLTKEDLENIFSNYEYVRLQRVVLLKNYLLEYGYTNAQIDLMTLDELSQTSLKEMKEHEEDPQNVSDTFIERTITEGIEFLDMDKLLLISTRRILASLEDFSSIDDEAIEIMKETERNIKKLLDANIISKKAKCTMKLEERIEEISLKKIEDLVMNFYDGIYAPRKIKIEYIDGMDPNLMSEWSDSFINKLDITYRDKFILSLVNFDNFKRMYKLQIIDDNDIAKILTDLGRKDFDLGAELRIENQNFKDILEKNSNDFFKNLYDSNILSTENLRNYFIDGIITKDMLDSLDENRTEQEKLDMYGQLRVVFDNEFVLNKYKEYVEKYIEFINFQATNPEEIEKIEELREKVNKLRIEKDDYKAIFMKYNSNLSEIEKNELGKALLEKYYLEMEVQDQELLQETIKVLYEDKMIDLENIIYLGRKYIIPMLDKLSLDDASKVRNSMTFKELEEMVDMIFLDESFSDERKFIVVMNLFIEDTKQDNDAREFYIGLLDFNNSEKKATPRGTAKNITGNIAKNSKKYIYPDFVKWRFYKGLDKDIRTIRYMNGFLEFASTKLGVRIIEKYYDGDKPAYGTATYILPEDDYRKNQGNLVTITPKGNILESAVLRSITPKKDRVAHRTQSTERTWMDEIVKYFQIDYERQDDTRYTEEELRTLEDTVKKYKTRYDEIK